jgi:hypothetical protein
MPQHDWRKGDAMCPACLAVIKHPLLIGGSAVGVFIVFLTKRLQRDGSTESHPPEESPELRQVSNL